MFSMEAETLLAQVVARAHQLPGVGRGSSPVQGRGHCRGGRGGQGGLVWNTPALAHMVSPLFIVVMRILFLFIKYRFDNLSLVPFFSGGTVCWDELCVSRVGSAGCVSMPFL